MQTLRRVLLAGDLAAFERAFAAITATEDTEKEAACEVLCAHGLFAWAARLKESLGDRTAACDLFEQADLWTDAGRLAESLGDLPRAEALYRRAIPTTPTQFAPKDQTGRCAAHRLGLLLWQKGQVRDAVVALQHARRALLCRTSQPQPSLLSEIESLLAQAFDALRLGDVSRMLRNAASSRLPSPQRLAQLPQPTTEILLGRYRLVRLLGAGGMGRVFLAQDLSSNKEVAIKLFAQFCDTRHPSFRRFAQEARLLGSLRSPNLIAVLDFSETAGVLVMEHLRCGSLAEQPLPLSLTKARRVLLDVIAGLEVAHSAGVLHRDLKPHNLLLDDTHRTKIGDFGVSHLAQLGATQTEGVIGTLAYLSPEQVVGQPLDFSTDLYSLGVTLFQLLTGELPFAGPDFAHDHVHTPPPNPCDLRPGLPLDWGALCLSLMCKNRSDRPGSLSLVRAAVERLSDREDSARQTPGEKAAPSGAAFATWGDPARTQKPNIGTPERTLLFHTPHSQVFQTLDNDLLRPLVVEQFSPDALAGPLGLRHLAWLRNLAGLSGPGVQRIVSLQLHTAQPEVHYEPLLGTPSRQPLWGADCRILKKVLDGIHATGEIHGHLADSIWMGPHGATLQIMGRGPLFCQTPEPSPAQEMQLWTSLFCAPDPPAE